MLDVCIVLDCRGHEGQIEAIHHGQQEILRRFDRLERLIINEGKITMSELTDQLAQVLAAVDAVDTNVARELADFANTIGGKLSDDERAQFAAITTKLANINVNVDAVDPQPATPPVDGSGDSGTPTA